MLRGAGSSVLFSGAATSGALFTCAAFLPIPLLRQFSLQSAILILANLVACLIVFPACVTLDLRRRRVGHADLLCCVKCAQQPHEREGLVQEGGKCQRGKGIIGKYVEGLNNGKVKMVNLEEKKIFGAKI